MMRACAGGAKRVALIPFPPPQMCHERVPVEEGSEPTEKKIINPTFDNFLLVVTEFRVTKRFILGAKAPNMGPFWDFENYDKLDPPRGIEDVAMFVKRVKDGRGVIDASSRKGLSQMAKGGLSGADGAVSKRKAEISSLNKEISSLQQAKKKAKQQAERQSMPNKDEGAYDYSTTKGGAAVKFTPRGEDLIKFTEVFTEDGEEDGDVPCCQAFLNVLFPRGPTYTNGVLSCGADCEGGDSCQGKMPLAELRSTYGSKKVDKVKNLFEYFGYKPGGRKSSGRSPGGGRGRGRGRGAGKTPHQSKQT